MRTRTRDLFAHVGRSAAGLLISCSAIAPAMAAGAYTPTMQDLMSIQDTLHNYHEGLDKHDNKLMAKAFTEDGTLWLIDDRGMEMKVTGRDKIAIGGFAGDGPPPGGAPGAAGAGGPPAGGAPPAGAQGGPPPGGAGAPTAGPMGEVWHFTGDNHFVFESATRATHYGYWLDLRPGDDRKSSVGIPGHYEDILVKDKSGQWLFKERKIIVGKK